MPNQLLSTKFFVPHVRKGWVPRPRLIKRLDPAMHLPISIITAPPGSGKTTLLAEWLLSVTQRTEAPTAAIAWVSLDTDDNALERFWAYLITALQKGLDDSLAAVALDEIKGLLASNPPPYQIFLTPLINEINSLALSLILVLDDYHVILNPAISDSLAYLVDHMPANLHLVIASRTDPPLPLGRWRGRGLLNMLRAQELRFSPEEEVALLNGSMGLALSPAHVADLDQRTEGWAAGLQMAGFALQDKEETEITQAIQSFSGRHHLLLDFFTDEILQRQPEEIQQFLLQTAILNQMCADLCSAVVAGNADSKGPVYTPTTAQTMLEYLERANLFVVALDSERHWYRYHHLFNDLLLTRLRQTVGQAGEGNMRRRASAWYAGRGHLSEAIHQALQAQDFDLAADLIESPAQSARVWESGEIAIILKWSRELPPEVVQERLWLRLHRSHSLFYNGQAAAAEAILEEIEQKIQHNPAHVPHKERLLGMVLSHQARYASVRSQVQRARELAEQALAILPEEEVEARSFVFPTLALSAYRMGDVEEAARLFEETAHLTRRAGSRFQTIGNLSNLAITQLAQGKLSEVLNTTQQAIQIGTIGSTALPASGWARFPLAEALYEQNRLAEAESMLHQGLQLIAEGQLTNYFGQMPALLARTQFALGKVDDALETIAAALASARRSTVAFYEQEITSHQARLWARSGRLAEAERWADAYQARHAQDSRNEVEEINLADVLLAAGRASEARKLLLPMAADAQSRRRFGREITIRALLAVACLGVGDANRARAELERALQLGEPEGYIQPFLNLGAPLGSLLAALAADKDATRSQAVDRQYLQRLLNAFPAQQRPAQAPRSRHPEMIEPLTARELEVLQLLAKGLTNREIAGRLYLSTNTLKVYTNNLYEKLDVHNRTQAVTRAQALGLI